MRPTPLRYPAIPLLCLLLSATACVEEETLDAPESGSLTAISNNLETPEATATTDEPAEVSADEAAPTEEPAADSGDDAAPSEEPAEVALGRYVVDFCDQPGVLQTEAISLAEARENCALNDIYNPQ